MPGIAPRRMSSRLGLVAAVMEMVSPSQLSPAVIHRISSSATLGSGTFLSLKQLLSGQSDLCAPRSVDCRRFQKPPQSSTQLAVERSTAVEDAAARKESR